MLRNNPLVPGLVSVIVPVYNRAHLVARTIDSILNQTYRPVEAIAVNDGSTDTTAVVLEELSQKYGQALKIIHQKNGGQTKARNTGLAQVTGEYIAFLDSDDTWEPEKLSLQIPLFKTGVGLVYCAIHEVDEAGRILCTVPCEPGMRGEIYHHLLEKNRMTGGTVVVGRAALEQVGFFDESFQAAENWDLWIRISKRFRVDYVDLPLVRYLKHSGNLSQNHDIMQRASSEILAKHLPPGHYSGTEASVYKRAYANNHYGHGVWLYSQAKYPEARLCFYRAWKYRLFYQDSLERVLRSFLGSRINRLLSKLKHWQPVCE